MANPIKPKKRQEQISIYRELKKEIFRVLRGFEGTISKEMASSPRAIGDAMESIIKEQFKQICKNINPDIYDIKVKFARRAMEDVAFSYDKNHHVFDIKTHNLDAEFHMPNLTSVARLDSFYDNPRNFFAVIVIDYKIKTVNNENALDIIDIKISNVEQLDWDCLRIGALGAGQLQFKDAADIRILPNQTREEWMYLFYKELVAYYQKEVNKNRKRLQAIKRKLKVLEATLKNKL